MRSMNVFGHLSFHDAVLQHYKKEYLVWHVKNSNVILIIKNHYEKIVLSFRSLYSMSVLVRGVAVLGTNSTSPAGSSVSIRAFLLLGSSDDNIGGGEPLLVLLLDN